MMVPLRRIHEPKPSLWSKIWQIHWVFVLLLTATASVGFAMLYSAANGSLDPWADRQMVRFVVGIGLLVAVAVTDIRIWFRYAYVIYFVAFVLLVGVEIMGDIGMGARRWLDVGIISLQPSEVMKIAIALSLARYFHCRSPEEVGRLAWLIPPVLMILAPVGLVLRQPDLGTAVMLMAVGVTVLFLAGVKIWKFVVFGGLGLGAVPLAWNFLHDYQKKRVLTFINPENDPLGSGYHIIQSQIALGSGGIAGKGFLQGTQSHLSFLPEMQTDFIFTMLAEEFGMIGGVVLLSLYALLFIYGYAISMRSRSQFGRLLGLGMTTTFFLYVFINIAMVMGLIPVVGIPLPLVSYGGTAMLSLLFGLGLVMCVYVHRDVAFGRRGLSEDF